MSTQLSSSNTSTEPVDHGVVTSDAGEVLVYWEWGVAPRGAFPTQGEGHIVVGGTTEQRVYFRYRGGQASLCISRDDRPAYSKDDGNTAAYFKRRVVSPDEMPVETINQLVACWAQAYVDQQ